MTSKRECKLLQTFCKVCTDLKKRGKDTPSTTYVSLTNNLSHGCHYFLQSASTVDNWLEQTLDGMQHLSQRILKILSLCSLKYLVYYKIFLLTSIFKVTFLRNCEFNLFMLFLILFFTNECKSKGIKENSIFCEYHV